ncbi:MAG: hypothetical protein A2Y33_13545 [Spirochaetes bacterium GWF1_51_8]|nr:MAG: hypothetical protein A2Y33_13545 [Spirochaetes bacterium GWF1_51_8]
MNIGLKGNDFLSLKEFDLSSPDESNVVLLLGENKSGKTQALKLVYSFLSALSEAQFEKRIISIKKENTNYLEIFHPLFYHELETNFVHAGFGASWGNGSDLNIIFRCNEIVYQENKNSKQKVIEDKYNALIGKTIAISPNGFGDYYKGIFAIQRFYADNAIFSNYISDLVYDLFIVSDAKRKKDSDRFTQELNEIVTIINADFNISDNKIIVMEKGKEYPLEAVASGLKTFAPLILAMKHGLIEDTLIIDEPEVSLHPAWIEVMAELLYKISKKGVKVFIATHSDVFIEKMNWFLKHDAEFNLDVWKFERKEDGNHARTLELEDREVPTAEYLKVYYEIVKGF